MKQTEQFLSVLPALRGGGLPSSPFLVCRGHSPILYLSPFRWGLCVSVQMILCQSGMSVGRLCGEDGGVGEGEVGMSCQFSSVVSCFVSVRCGLGGLEFHFLFRILLRIAREESPPLIVIFSRSEVSFVLPFRDHR